MVETAKNKSFFGKHNTPVTGSGNNNIETSSSFPISTRNNNTRPPLLSSSPRNGIRVVPTATKFLPRIVARGGVVERSPLSSRSRFDDVVAASIDS